MSSTFSYIFLFTELLDCFSLDFVPHFIIPEIGLKEYIPKDLS